MFNPNTVALLALGAALTPAVCQAQDPSAVLNQVKELAAAGNADKAIEACDKMVKRFSGEGAMAQQFGYVVPFFLNEKANILFKNDKYDAAFEVFKDLATNKKWQSGALNEAAKRATGSAEGLKPQVSYANFMMGYCLYKQAAGTEKTPGDPSKFADAVKYLDAYLGMLKSGKVSALEKKQKMDGQVSFLLMQACLLQPTPDFKKANAYLEQSRAGKAKLPDDMAMSGLTTIVRVACENPQYVDWIYKVIESSPASFKLGPLRGARFNDKFFNMGLKVGKVSDAAYKGGDVKTAMEGMRSMNALFGLVQDTPVIIGANKAVLELLGKYTRPIKDSLTSTTHVAGDRKKVMTAYAQNAKDKIYIEAFAVVSGANAGYTLGCARLAKAGYQVAFDHYRDMSRKEKGETKSMKDSNIYQLAQFCYATGDEDAGAKYEKMLAGKDMGNQQKNMTFNKLRRALKENRWEDVISDADTVMDDFKDDADGKYYITAQFAQIAANFKLQNFAEVISKGQELINSGKLKPQEGKLKADEAANYDRQARFFVLDSQLRLGKSEPSKLDDVLKSFDAFIDKYPSMDLKENPLAVNAYYDAIDALLTRRGHGEDQACIKDEAQAVKYCALLAEHWPHHDLTPRAQLLDGNVQINGKAATDESKLAGMKSLEQGAQTAIEKGQEKDLAVAANALYWLASYAPELPNPGETPEALQARTQGYMDLFWAKADFPGNVYALQMAVLQLSRASKGKDANVFDKAVEIAQKTIAREADVAFKAGKLNPELEKSINSYASAYMDGMKNIHEKTLSLQEKIDHFSNFPGINPEDKYCGAILRMSLISAMNAELAAIKDDEAAKAKLNDDIERAFRDMTNSFKPAELTSFICVQVGDYLVKYVGRFDNPASKTEEIKTAVSYFDQAISRGKDNLNEAKLGKAKILGYSNDEAAKKESVELYKELSDASSTDIAGPALLGLTENYIAMGNFKEAVDSANKFVKNRRLTRNRLDMYLLLGQAYAGANDPQNALLAYMNIYNQNRGNIGYSAPACMAMMDIMWKRNNAASGDRIKGNYKASDRWTAWKTGQDFLNQIKSSKLEGKMTPSDRDKYNALVKRVAECSGDPAVQKEEREKKAFEARLNNK